MEKHGSDSESSKQSDQGGRRQRAAKRLRSPEEKLRHFEDRILEIFSSFKEDMNAKFDNLNKKLSDIQNDLEKSLDFMATRVEETKKELDSVKKDYRDSLNRINTLEDNIENLLRSARSSSLKVRNVPHTPDETKEVLIKYAVVMGESIKSRISASEIRDIFRIPGKTDTNKPIIVEFTSTLQKNEVYKAVKTYNATNRTTKLNSSHLGMHGNVAPVFVAEHLTSKANRLHFLARELTKAQLYKYCWTSNGKVFLRKTDGSPPILVKSENQIKQLDTST